MKIIRLLSLSWIFILGCDPDEPPQYSEIPFVKDATLEFIEGPGITDTLALTFYFRDGDFDLGLQPDVGSADLEVPYHPLNLYVESNGTLTKTESLTTDGGVYVPSSQHTGKIATHKRIVSSGASAPSYSCYDYYYGDVFLFDHDLADNSDNIIELNSQFVLLRDTFLIEVNLNHYNLDVEFWVEQPGGSFEIFDWAKDVNWGQIYNCHYTFDARFPDLRKWTSDVKNGPFQIDRKSKYSGELRYAMPSASFKALLKSKNVKITVSIKDRALNRSNVIESNVIKIPD
jgi:hypothetical protein